MLEFSGKVALVTGAGGGLGRIYALQFAERGASVVVNDLGGDMKGGGASSRPADKVVEEIRAKGGKAVANYDSVEHGEKLVETAIKNFGRIDIVVNNAGILRDRSFARISDEDWDLIHRVHMRGSFKVSRAAWPHMKEQKYGRIIMVSSPAGIYGNFGQANYAAAKLGLVGLSNTLAKEGKKYNIHSNAIAPTAGSRLLQTVMPQDLIDALKPEYISPLVLYLCHEDCPETGGLFECGAGWIGKTRWQNSFGALVANKNMATGEITMTPESVKENFEKISDFQNAEYRTDPKDVTARLLNSLTALDSGQELQAPASKGSVSELAPNQWRYSDKDVILYALGVGCSTSQDEHLKFLFEWDENFCALPTFAVLPAFVNSLINLDENSVPGITIDPTKILHGEQYLEVYKPLATEGILTSKMEIADVLDKGTGALILIDVTSYDESGAKVAFVQMSTFVVGAGGFGGKRVSDKAFATLNKPDRKPDASLSEKTSLDQAALYRLSGDRNPLHLDPTFAAMGGECLSNLAGFDKPILHGLCTFGFAVRQVLKRYAGNDVTKFKSVKVRFAKPVLPGQTIRTDMWKEGNRIHFEAVVVETGKVAISGGYVNMHSTVVSQPEAADTGSASSSTLKSAALFTDLAKRVESQTGLASKVGAVFQFNVTKDGKVAGTWTADLKSTPACIYSGEPKSGKPGCTLILSDDDLVSLAAGKLNAQKAFMNGKLKVTGNIMLSTKLQALFNEKSKL